MKGNEDLKGGKGEKIGGGELGEDRGGGGGKGTDLRGGRVSRGGGILGGKAGQRKRSYKG